MAIQANAAVLSSILMLNTLRLGSIGVVTALLAFAIGSSAGAEIVGEMTFSSEFAAGIDSAAIVTERCSEGLDCEQVEASVYETLRAHGRLPFGLQRPSATRSKLMAAGVLDYEADRREEIAAALEVEGLLVLRIYGERESNMTGGSRPRVKFDIFLIRVSDGKITAQGGGGGSARFGGTSTERALQEAVERTLAARKIGETLRSEASRKLDGPKPG